MVRLLDADGEELHQLARGALRLPSPGAGRGWASQRGRRVCFLRAASVESHGLGLLLLWAVFWRSRFCLSPASLASFAAAQPGITVQGQCSNGRAGPQE